ncbi:MAG: sodium:proton antiporter [Chitinophagaceae bacterium]|nr:sodium:proton antiporter [Oligoflexus sp.]
MDVATIWFLIVGGVFLAMAGFGPWLERLPLTTGIVYVLVGVSIGPFGLDLLSVDLFKHAVFLEHVTEIAVIVSLFTAGLKLTLPLTDPQWRLAASLATLAMIINIALVAGLAFTVFGFSPGAALLLGAILSPTDPVLASDVQIAESEQRDRLRFALTAEGGLNDGTCFPFVLLGLGLLGNHELGSYGSRWIGLDLVWPAIGGIVIGYLMGLGVSRCIIFLRTKHDKQESKKLDDFLTLGLIALSYGVALAGHTNGFLAVFAAGIALRSISRPSIKHELDLKGDEGVDEVIKATADLPKTVLGFNEQLERTAEVVVCILLGSLIDRHTIELKPWIFACALLFVARPISAGLTIFRNPILTRFQKKSIAWLGIRGIGSIYYLVYTITHGLDPQVAQTFASITFGSILLSILLHGGSVTPLMNIYEHKLQHYRKRLATRKIRLK